MRRQPSCVWRGSCSRVYKYRLFFPSLTCCIWSPNVITSLILSYLYFISNWEKCASIWTINKSSLELPVTVDGPLWWNDHCTCNSKMGATLGCCLVRGRSVQACLGKTRWSKKMQSLEERGGFFFFWGSSFEWVWSLLIWWQKTDVWQSFMWQAAAWVSSSISSLYKVPVKGISVF